MKSHPERTPAQSGGILWPLLALIAIIAVLVASFVFTDPKAATKLHGFRSETHSADPTASTRSSAEPRTKAQVSPETAPPVPGQDPTRSTVSLRAASSLQIARELNQAFIQVAESVQPSVVVIKVVQKPEAPGEPVNHPLLESLPEELRKEFEKYFDRGNPRRRGRPERQQGQGSGVVMRSDGYILTNDHVVENADEITVVLKDGREFPAEVRGTDPKSDLAVIKLKEEAPGLVVARFADSESVRVGEYAVAIGAPFELDYSVTFGHVSAKGRSDVVPTYLSRQAGSMDQDFIQTDASINPGNSGGPLVNIDGEVIGINSLIRGMSTGIGFAIPSNFARKVGEAIIAEGKYSRSWLGIGLESLRNSPVLREAAKDLKEGVVVRSFVKNGPAEKSDLKPNDIIVTVDGQRVYSVQSLRNEIRDKKAGSVVTLDIVRFDSKQQNRENLQIEVRPELWPEEPSERTLLSRKSSVLEGESEELGITVKAWSVDLAKKYELRVPGKGEKGPAGLVITSVTPDGLGGSKGLKPGDLITEVNQEAVADVEEFTQAVGQFHNKEGGLLLTVTRKATGEAEMVQIESKDSGK